MTMKMTRPITRALALAALTATFLPSAARADDGDQQRAKMRVEVRTHIEQALAQAAGLDPATAQRVSQAIDRSDDQLAQIQRDNHAAYEELKHLVESGSADNAAINRLMDRMMNNRQLIQRNENERSHDVRTLVTPTQFAKIIIAFPIVNRQIRAQVRKALMEHANAVDEALGGE
jgi:Spy/CpxP family protein refolding chaperone